MIQPSGADQLLANREWRWRHSLWLLALFFGCGLLSWVGFLYVALRVRTRPFVRAAVIALVASIVSWVVTSKGEVPSTTTPGEKTLSDAAGAVVMLVWLGLLVYGLVLNRSYLRWRASAAAAPWYSQPSGAAMSAPRAQTRMPHPPPVMAPPAPRLAPAPPTDLRGRLDRLADQVHNGPQLPADVRASVGQIFDRLREVLARSQALATRPEHLHVVGRIVDDYLPTSLNAYVRLPRGYAETHRGTSGRTPHDELLHQLDLLHRQLTEIAEATYAGDAARLEAQGRFLEDRFRRSELDLS